MIIYQGAEAILSKENYIGIEAIRKNRKPKEYRIKKLDEEIRKKRTKREAKLMRRSRKTIKTPYILEIDSNSIVMENIEGKTLKEVIEKGEEDPKKIGGEIGKRTKRLHKRNIVHNDLTTSNMIKKEDEIYFIDFGLAEKTKRTEDKAADLLVFKKMLKSIHWREMKDIWRGLKKEYNDKETLARLKDIEKRVRYSE